MRDSKNQTQYDGARMISVIETDLVLRGAGTQESPLRKVKQFWSLDGELLAEVDPFAKTS